jgi:hypothetical protein
VVVAPSSIATATPASRSTSGVCASARRHFELSASEACVTAASNASASSHRGVWKTFA